MFRDRDLPLRLLAACLPPRLGYALARAATPALGGERMRGVERVVRSHVAEVLGDGPLADEAGRRFAGSLACDDLDGLIARLWPRGLRRASLTIEGEENLPPPGRAVFATFHLGGGFRVYDALLDRGFRPAVIAAPPDPGGNLYRRVIDRARFSYLRQALGDGVLPVGPRADRRELRSPAPHLAAGGAVVAVLDVSPGALGLRDALPTRLFGRSTLLPAGVLRLAAGAGVPVIPFDARLERGRRVLRFHPQLLSSDPRVLLDGVVAAMERSIRERPWDWQGWIDVHALLGGEPAAPTDGPAIVIPIHDAAEDARRCIESVLAHAPAEAAVVLVDDASRDAGLRGWLDGLPTRDRRVSVLRNGANLGFVASANRGIAAAAGRDVLLLNSDTMVPAGFVERLRDASRATPSTGLVSPFTNSGEIFTLPGVLDGPDPPSPRALAHADAMVAATSPRETPLVPTGHGFCLWIRAEVLRRVGAFDEAAFGRGYGEENDLCERARAAGFETRLCDDLFVWHRGGASFGPERDALVARHLEVIEERHPGYRERIRAFVERDPLAAHRERVRPDAPLGRAGLAPAMLLVLHADPFVDPRRENIGGTQYHVLDLVRGLALPRALVAWPDPAGTAIAEIGHGDLDAARIRRFAHRRPAGGIAASRFTLRDPDWEAAIGRLVDALGVGAVHLHHLAFWPVGLHRELSARGIAYAFTVQDYHCVCPSWNLLDLSTAERCDCEGTPETRLRCLRAWYGACGLDAPADPESLLRAHREEFALLLGGAHAVVAGCETTRRIVERAHPGGDFRWAVLPYGYDRGPVAPGPRVAGPLRVALLGAVAAPWKGSGQVLRTMESLRDLGVEWHVFGDSDAHDFPARAREAAGGHERVVVHGRYRREEIVARLRDARVDASLLLSPWDETFCYTLSESWAAGVPAIVSDRGALAERMRATGGGAVARDAAQAADLLRRAAGDPSLLEGWRRAAVAHREPTVADNAARHRELWGEVLARLASTGDRPARDGS